MKRILVTGATGFIGKNLVNYLLKRKYTVRVFVRDTKKFHLNHKDVEVYTGDLTRKQDVTKALKGVYAAYYLVHSMSHTSQFKRIERLCAENFAHGCSVNTVKRIIYLGGIIDSHCTMSKHLQSRETVGNILRTSKTNVTELRAAIIIGKDGASYRMIQLLVERSPVLILPTLGNTLCQPIALEDVLYYLEGCLKKSETAGNTYDIGGTTTVKYVDMLKVYGKVIKKLRTTVTIPFLPLTILSFCVSIVTRQPFSLVRSLIESLRCKTICQETNIRKILPRKPLSYRQAIRKAF